MIRDELSEKSMFRRKQMLEQKEKHIQEQQAIFEEILNKMNVGELHKLQCRISEMILEQYKLACSDYNDLIRY